ncbi:MAG: nucleotide pyrophosphohydrolase [Gemmataceae bacterium]
MADDADTLASLKAIVRRFVDERDWQRFHTPKNLSMGLAAEAAELLEHFLWVDGAESLRLADDPTKREAIADEMADVFAYLLNFSMTLGIDLSDALAAKMIKNAKKYPAEQYKGKYTLGS